MRLQQWLSEATARLSAAGVASASLESKLIAGHVLLVDRTWIVTHPEHEIEPINFEQVLQRRENQEPLAYILGFREFFGRRFRVDPNVLIPRHETEVLVEEVLKLGPAPLDVLDVGTGSGCIAITLKLERPEWNITACDISGGALQIARENAETLGAEVTFRHSDLLEAFEAGSVDVIVSNPPYIDPSESLPVEVRSFEPHTALFGGLEGMELYQRLRLDAPRVLRPGGRVFLEIGQTQADAIRELFEGAEIVKDLDGNDRVAIWQV
ncbi:MAG TPA: peptide chain release factor N(5)-glutamine methyltransferase [Fimbriimonas sp.]|nr:peptide chain release factor N(5)-glutamine methyltransferase [Fimbriimonas sp.]